MIYTVCRLLLGPMEITPPYEFMSKRFWTRCFYNGFLGGFVVFVVFGTELEMAGLVV